MVQRPMYAFEPDGRWYAMALGTQTVQIWQLGDIAGENDEPDGELKTEETALVGIAFAGDTQLVTVHEMGEVVGWSLESILEGEPTRLWRHETGMTVRQVTAHRGTAAMPCLVALGGAEGELAIGRFDGADEGQWTAGDDGHAEKIEVLAFSGDGRRLATSGRDREIAIWAPDFATDQEGGATLKRVQRLKGSGGWPLSLAFSDDGRRLASGCMDNGVYHWDLEASDNPLIGTRFDHHGWVEDVAFVGDGETILSASWDGTVGVYRADPLQPVLQFMYHGDYVVSVLPVPNSTLVFAASYDGEVTVWDWQKGSLEAILEGHGDWVTDVVWLGNEVVASLSSDGTTRLWSAADLESVAVLGKPEVETFKLEGGLDLASFGVGDSQDRREERQGPDLKKLQTRVVRRFDGAKASLSAGGGDRAMAILEEAVDASEDIEAPELDAEIPERSDEIDEFQSSPEMGDELSDMVLDAISDVEETQGSEVSDLSEEPEESEEDSDPAELINAPEMEVASGEHLGEELDLDGSDASSAATAEEFVEDAFGDVDDDIDIMSSEFDHVDKKGESSESLQESLQESEESEKPEKSAAARARSEERMPTSGPLYDPKPLSDDDEIDELLPDDEMLDLAFSSSFAEVVGQDEDAGGEGDEEGDKDAGDDNGDRDQHVEDETSDDERGPPGKAKPSSAGGSTTKAADDGKATQWSKSRQSTTLTRGKPLAVPGDSETDDSVSEASSVAESDSEKPSRSSTAPGYRLGGRPMSPSQAQDQVEPTKGNRTLTPFSSVVADDDPFVIDDVDGEEQPWSPSFKGRKLLERLSRKLESEKASPVEKESPVEKASPVEKESPVDPVSEAKGENDLESEATDGGLENTGVLKMESMQIEPPAQALGREETESRFNLVAAGTESGVETPEPEESKSAATQNGDSSYSIHEISLAEMWQRASGAAPQMGILKRRLSPGGEYQPFRQRDTDHRGGVCLAVSPNQKRLVTGGQQGTVEVWDFKKGNAIHFQVAGAKWLMLGFIEGERLIFGLDKSGRIYLWLLPLAVSESASQLPQAVIEESAIRYRCGYMTDEGEKLLTGSDDGLAHLWSLKTGKCLARLTGHDGPVSAVTFGKKGPITATLDGQIRFWNRRGLLIDQIKASGAVCDIEASKGNVVWTEQSGALSMMQEGASRAVKLQGHHGEGRAVMFRDDGHFISGGEDGRLLLYNAATAEMEQEIHIPAPVQQVALKSRILASGCAGGVLYVFRRSRKKRKVGAKSRES